MGFLETMAGGFGLQVLLQKPGCEMMCFFRLSVDLNQEHKVLLVQGRLNLGRYVQWIILVLVIGGRDYITPKRKRYTLPSG